MRHAVHSKVEPTNKQITVACTHLKRRQKEKFEKSSPEKARENAILLSLNMALVWLKFIRT
jgi:endonuclease/exonuclease/phosphatase family metal-dependent hydrolase